MEIKESHIEVVTELLTKVQKYAQERQLELYNSHGTKLDSLNAPQLQSFGLIRVLVFCALEDSMAFKGSLNNQTYEVAKLMTRENFKKELMPKAVLNYRIYNYIVRFQSIIETCSKSFVPKNKFKQYLATLEPEKAIADKVIRAWRNTIHRNGFLDTEETYFYRGKNILIPIKDAFQFDFWTLYRLSKDCIDNIYSFADYNIRDNSN
jgi:hypothetical protein